MIKMGESESLEFKEKPTDDPKKYVKTAVAFANCMGGSIVFGVKDNGKVVGLESISKCRDQIVDTLYANISPPMTPKIYAYSIDGKDLLVVEISAQLQLPFYYRPEGPDDGVYIRVGASTRKADPLDIIEMSYNTSPLSPDSILTEGLLEKDDERIEWLCSKLSRRKGDNVTVDDLVGLNLITSSKGKYKATRAFRLLTDNPYNYAGLQCARLFGPSETEFSDRTEFKGSILTQVDNGLEYVLSKLNKPSRINGLYREDMFELPVSAIREVILNAILHRSYSLDINPIFIAVFDDRVEVTSPGGLPSGQTLEGMMSGHSIPRNRLLATVFKECKLSEGWGRGLRRVYEQCKKAGIKDPKIDVTGSQIIVTLYRPTGIYSQASITSNESAVARYILSNPTSTISDMCDELSLSKHDVEVAIKSLKDSGRLRREGSRKRGEWILDTGSFREYDLPEGR